MPVIYEANGLPGDAAAACDRLFAAHRRGAWPDLQLIHEWHRRERAVLALLGSPCPNRLTAWVRRRYWRAAHQEVSDLGFLERADLGDLGRDDEGNTVLHRLVPFLPGDHLRAILAYWREVNAANHAGQSALHLAIRHDRLNIVVALLEHGADPNLRNAAGSTSLHCAVCHVTSGTQCLADMVAVLTADGADGSLRDRSGHTAGYYAARQGFSPEFIRLFSARPVLWQERLYF
jgi:hypothetical protein